MKRVIKCRGRNAESGQWVYGSAFDMPDGSARIVFCDETGYIHHVPVDPATIGEFIGLHDENGREIYEDDVLDTEWFQEDRDFLGKDVTRSFLGKVLWLNNVCGFMMQDISRSEDIYGYFCIDGFTVRVVWNVHENPELITKPL